MQSEGGRARTDYDFPNQMVLVTIEAKRDPERAKEKFQRAIDEAAKQA